MSPEFAVAPDDVDVVVAADAPVPESNPPTSAAPCALPRPPPTSITPYSSDPALIGFNHTSKNGQFSSFRKRALQTAQRKSRGFGNTELRWSL